MRYLQGGSVSNAVSVLRRRIGSPLPLGNGDNGEITDALEPTLSIDESRVGAETRFAAVSV